MKFTKTALATLIAAALPLSALASPDLFIHNSTDNYSTSIINNGFCSTKLGEAGVTKPGEKNHQVSGGTVRLACIGHWTDCKAKVYMSADCTGPVVATVLLDIEKGIKSIEPQDPSFTVTGSGFDIYLNNPSLFLTKTH